MKILNHVAAGLFTVFVFTGVFAKVDVRWGVAAMVVALIAALAFRKRRDLASVLSADERGALSECVYMWLVASLLTGFVLRVIAVYAFRAEPAGDAALFWREISSWSTGNLCLTKSYTAVAFYGLLCAIFGKSLLLVGIANSVLGCVQTLLAFMLARRLFRNDSSALFAAFATALNPLSIYSAQLVMSEHLFATLMLLFFCLAFRVADEWEREGASTRPFAPLILAVVGMLAFYCRGNGLFLVIAAAFVAAVVWWRSPMRLAFARRIVLPFVIGAALVGVPVVIANACAYGRLVLGSSDDSVWPLLAGSDVSAEGRWAPSNYDRYRVKFTELTGRTDFSLYKDTHIVAPYIMQEIAARWRDDPNAQISLCFRKYRRLWSSGGDWAYGNRNMDAAFRHDVSVWHRDFMVDGAKRLKEVLCVLAVLCFLVLPFMRGSSASVVHVMSVFLLINVFNHFFCEEKPRYCYLLWVMLPVWSAGIFALFKGDSAVCNKLT